MSYKHTTKGSSKKDSGRGKRTQSVFLCFRNAPNGLFLNAVTTRPIGPVSFLTHLLCPQQCFFFVQSMSIANKSPGTSPGTCRAVSGRAYLLGPGVDGRAILCPTAQAPSLHVEDDRRYRKETTRCGLRRRHTKTAWVRREGRPGRTTRKRKMQADGESCASVK